MDHRELPKEGQLSQNCTDSEANVNCQTEAYATGLVFGEQGYRLGHLLRLSRIPATYKQDAPLDQHRPKAI
jgi:hypothetical protein